MARKELEAPQKVATDCVSDLVKAGVQVMPGGSLVSFLIDQVWQPPLIQKTQKWFGDVTERINSLGVQLEELRDNQRFISALTQAAQVVVRIHHGEKLKALRNAVVNSIRMPTYDEALQSMFITCVERLTPLCLSTLSFFNNANWLDPYKGRPFGNPKDFVFEILWDAFPSLKNRVETTEYLFRELKNQGLLNQSWSDSNSLANQHGRSLPKVTQLGKDFLDFISESTCISMTQ